MDALELTVGGVTSRAPGPARGDECALFSSSVMSQHRYVQVRRKSSAEAFAFAQLRPAAVHSPPTCISRGLWTALQLDEHEIADAVTLLVDKEQLGGAQDSAACHCRCGVVARVDVQIIARSPLPRAVVVALKRVLPKVCALSCGK
jgi:hypothetical protein